LPIVLATQKAEIRRTVVQSQPRQIVHETLSWKNPSQKRAVGVNSNLSTEKKKAKKTSKQTKKEMNYNL
jgi:hypothetical protein